MTTLHSEPSSDAGQHRGAALDAAVDPDEGDLLLRVSGIIPADDFHPFVVRVARALRLRGWIRHDPAGALIRAVGDELQLLQLVRALLREAPPTARIRSLDPEAITTETPPIPDHFAAMVDQPDEWHDPAPAGGPTLSHAAA
jgi:acylphosphatase